MSRLWSFFSRKEIELDRQNADGRTALWFAAHRNHLEVIGLLFQAGAHLRIADNDGRTPSDVARFVGHEECIQLLEVSK